MHALFMMLEPEGWSPHSSSRSLIGWLETCVLTPELREKHVDCAQARIRRQMRINSETWRDVFEAQVIAGVNELSDDELLHRCVTKDEPETWSTLVQEAPTFGSSARHTAVRAYREETTRYAETYTEYIANKKD